MANIFKTYETLQKHGHVLDQYGFDRRWLGKRPGYYAYLKSSGSRPSVAALVTLHFRLRDADENAARFGLNTGELADLASAVLEEVRQRCT